MKSNILFITAWIKSHIIPSFYIADLLVDQYNIYYAVPDEVLKGLVRSQGYQTIDSKTLRFAHGLEAEEFYSSYEAKQHRFSQWKIINNIVSNSLYHKRRKELAEIMNELQPSAVFIDVFSSTDFLILFPYPVKIFFFCPMLATSRSKDFQRSLQKKHAPWDVKKLMSNLSMRQFAKKSVTLAKNIVYKKVTLLQIIWAINKNTIPKKYSIIKNKFSYLFENVPEILLAPIELECHKRIKQNQHYLGLCVRPREDIAIPKEFEASFQKVKLQKELSGGKLIYCSFGSYSTDVVEQKEVFYFILALVEAVSCVPKIQVICSVGGIVANALETHAINPTNFYYFSRVPQLKVLGQCDLFITHGGLNSIKESIHFGVPMLVFPLDLNYDQNDNGYSVEYHGLGLTGDLRNEEPDLIKQKIMQLLWDESYKNRVKEFNQNLKQKYSEESARAKLVELFS